ncbi:MAG: hypothetical protein ACLFR1_10410 [Spirochaetia bacterium]
MRQLLRFLQPMAASDIRNISREPILIIVPFVPILSGAAARFLFPFIQHLVLQYFHFDISTFLPMLESILYLVQPMMAGFLTGFLLLDERDTRMIQYFSVTPMGRQAYLQYRVIQSFAIGFLTTGIFAFVSGLFSPNLYELIVFSATNAISAVFLTLLLGTFAKNKVEGLAITKLYGIVFLAPLYDFFSDSILSYSGAVIPYFWISRAYFSHMYSDSGFFIPITIAAALQLLMSLLMFFRFQKQIQ